MADSNNYDSAAEEYNNEVIAEIQPTGNRRKATKNKTTKESSNQAAKRKNSRRFTTEETLLFCEILVDTDDNFLVSLEKLALKNSANDEMFNLIKATFDFEVHQAHFVERLVNKYFTKKDGTKIPFEKLDTSVQKLRNKVRNLKSDWKKHQDVIKNHTGEWSIKDPEWWPILNPVLSETNSPVDLASSAQDTSFAQENSPVNTNTGNESDSEQDDTEDEETTNNDATASQAGTSSQSNKLVVKVHQKRAQVRSQKQALSELASGMKVLAESHMKRTKIMIDEDKKREERERKFRREEMERNRDHELAIARIYADAFAGRQNYAPPSAQYPMPQYRNSNPNYRVSRPISNEFSSPLGGYYGSNSTSSNTHPSRPITNEFSSPPALLYHPMSQAPNHPRRNILSTPTSTTTVIPETPEFTTLEPRSPCISSRMQQDQNQSMAYQGYQG